MANREDIALMGHLMRRAGFGASHDELQDMTENGYEATVDDLLNPERFDPIDDDLLFRYMPGYEGALGPPLNQAEWVYRMINTERPLEEKMALFWHQLFATGNSKVDNPPELTQQIAMFRRVGLGKFRDILVELAQNPAMIFWLDNNGNHMGAINENWGRELLELFSMGVGNYSEDDIKEASRAFTGWTIGPKIPRNPLGRFYWNFEYRPEDHDDGEKTFLGNTGNFDGQDIIDIVVNQPATARFLSRHLYNFFVADEPQVPSWNITPLTIPTPSTSWWQPTMSLMATFGRCCGCCSTRTSSSRHVSAASRVPPSWSSARRGWRATSARRALASTRWRSSAPTRGRSC